jgi:hypothetical protein
MIDDYWMDGTFYPGQFSTYALPGTTKDRVRFLNVDDTGLFYNLFACYQATPSWGLPDHAGTDVSAANGTNVLAAAGATEVYVVIDGEGDYRIRLRHPNVNGSGQTWYTFYVHLSASSFPLGVSAVSVVAGQKIGEVGRDHLHFQAAVGGSYANSEARNIWGIDQAPWDGCLWTDSSFCASPPGACCGCLPASCCSKTTTESEGFPIEFRWDDGAAPGRVTSMESGGPEVYEAAEPAASAVVADTETQMRTADEPLAVESDGAAAPIPAPVQRVAMEPRTPPSSASYRIAKSVLGSGGGEKISTSYVMNGTQGQSTDLSRRASDSYVLVPGYWGRWIPRTFGYGVYLPLVSRRF